MQCSVHISDSTGFYPTPCAKPAKVERGGKWFCTIHDPEYINRKKIERTAKYEAKGAVWVKDLRLQIAAPDLYAACQAALEWLAINYPYEHSELTKQLSAALEKAEGKLK